MHFPKVLLLLTSMTLSGSAEFPSDGLHRTFQHFNGEGPAPLSAKIQAKSINYEVPCGEYDGKFVGRIVKGEPAEAGEFPWVVSLQILARGTYRHNCGAAVINSSWVLTAAHCVHQVNPSNLRVIAGEYDLSKDEGHEQNRTVKRIITTGYNEDTYAKDIALLELQQPLELNADYVAPICLPEGQEKFEDTAVLAGWGTLADDGMLPLVLQKVALPLISKEKCDNIYIGTGYEIYKSQCQLCTLDRNGKDACQGDSGSPLMCYNTNDNKIYVCGVVSFGVSCGSPEYPGVYTEVECYTKWIVKTTNK